MVNRKFHLSFLPVLALVAGLGIALAQSGTAGTLLVSARTASVMANAASDSPDVSADGGVVVYASHASNLIGNDKNGQPDIVAYDRATRKTGRVSVSSKGALANGPSSAPVISADGGLVAFVSAATNLVNGDRNGVEDVFVRDLYGKTTMRVSVQTGGAPADGPSDEPAISANGRVVAFTSRATNLVPGDSNGMADVFVHDRQTGQTARVSVGAAAAQADWHSAAPTLSADGRFVAFHSTATTLVPGDRNYSQDIFVHDRQTGRTMLVSVSSDGTQGDGPSSNPSISADGRYVAFQSWATNLAPGDDNRAQDIFLHDRQTGRTTRLTVGRGDSVAPSISADGRSVAFQSWAADLTIGDSNNSADVFLYDGLVGTTSRVSVGAAATQANQASGAPALSPDGRYVAFHSYASNLIGGDSNGRRDVFLRDTGPRQDELPTPTPPGSSTPTATVPATTTPPPIVTPSPTPSPTPPPPAPAHRMLMPIIGGAVDPYP